MNKSAFLELIQQVSNISDQQTEELEKVAATFPYCQTAHLLLAKSAYDKGSMLSTQRLRRASSYATDRQLLKRIIYTAPTPEPVFEEAEPEEAVFINDEVLVTETKASVEAPAQPKEEPAAQHQEEAAVQEAEDLNQVYASAASVNEYAESTGTTEEERPVDEAEEELDSELALLLTFNSISSSSTDLLSQKNQFEEAEQEALDTVVDHYQETGEALAELTATAEDVPTAAEVGTDEVPTSLNPDGPFETQELVASEETADENAGLILEEDEDFQEETNPLPANPEDAEINYTVDEIDRLYAEDALGYWMGSSRLGEVLQLKDEYTRPRPQSFHPELILEYSKTHELEKAIQTNTHVLSTQLDIIDQFLKLNPRLKTMANMKLKPEPQEDLSLKSSKIKKGTASESLAAIFLKQGKTKKAVKIYEQLILKYPEKKSYFAEQIEKLQNIT
jgi:tetratricopeptide (TPR) repeat protein